MKRWTSIELDRACEKWRAHNTLGMERLGAVYRSRLSPVSRIAMANLPDVALGEMLARRGGQELSALAGVSGRVCA